MPDLLQPAHRINSQVPFAFAVTLAKSMALDRKQRYQSAKQMLEALRQIKLAIEAEIAERERQEEETRQRKASRRRQSKDSARQPSERAERAERAEPAKKAKKAVVAEVAPIERQQEEKPKSPEKESRQRKTGQQRQRKAAARQPSEKAERAERSKRAKKAVAAGVAEREQLDEESRRHEEVARMATVLDEVGNRQEDPAIMALALPQDADTRLITRQTVTIEQPIDQEDAASEPEPAEPPARRKTLRAALGKIAANLLVALVAYLLWNITLVVYLLWSFARAHR